MELRDVVHDKEEERDRVAQELQRCDAVLRCVRQRQESRPAGGGRGRGGVEVVHGSGAWGWWWWPEAMATRYLEEDDAGEDDDGVPRDGQELEHDDVGPLDDHEGARVDEEACNRTWWRLQPYVMEAACNRRAVEAAAMWSGGRNCV